MKIGIDIRNIGKKRTGDEAVFFNLVKNLAEIDQNNQYLLFTDFQENAELEILENALGIRKKSNFKIISLKTLNRFSWNFWTLPNYLRKNLVSVYHTQYITPFFVPKKIKIVTTIHDISFNFFPSLIKYSDLLFLKILIPKSLRRAEKIVAVSNFTRDEVIKFYGTPPEKVVCIQNAVEDGFVNDELSRKQLESARKKYKLPKEFILYIGTMQPRKNLPTLVEAYAELRHKFPEVKLVLAGRKGAYNFDKKINDVIARHSISSDVIFPGYVDGIDKLSIFKLASAFCLPSLYEGFGIPVLEAMAAGTPTVISDIEPHREVAGQGSLFFDAKSPGDLVDKLSQVLSYKEVRNDLVVRGKEQVRKFSWKDSARKILDIYKDLEKY